jgi:hypothetical protein
MMTAPFARLGGFPFALVALITVNGMTSAPAPDETARSLGAAIAEANAPRRQRRRGEAAMLATARLVATEPVLTRRGTRLRSVLDTATLVAGPGPRLVTTLTRRGSRLRPATQTKLVAALH